MSHLVKIHIDFLVILDPKSQMAMLPEKNQKKKRKRENWFIESREIN